MSTKPFQVTASIALLLSACAATSEYDIRRAQAARELPLFERAYADKGCSDLRFRFETQMAFGKPDALTYLDCLEIERRRDDLRAEAHGTISEDELTSARAHDNLRSIFTHFASGELSFERAFELYRFVIEKSRMQAQDEIGRSNQLLAQGMENERRAWEQMNASREAMLQSMRQPSPVRPPTVTTCNVVLDSVVCTTR
jgi:hypothetical protein